MDPFLIGIIGIVVFLIFLSLGVHIGVALGLVGVFGLAVFLGLKPAITVLATSAFHLAADPSFIAIPCFTLMGLAAMYGGISDATFNALNKIIGRFRGGLGIASVAACTAFGAVCGSSAVTAQVFAKASCPPMRRQGYDKRLAYGLVTTSGIIGMLIPPSMFAVIYGLVTGESIGALLMAGVGPGLLLGVLFSGVIIVISVLKPKMVSRGSVEGASLTKKERLAAIKGLWPIAISALVVTGGIYGGVFTPTEASAWGALSILIISMTWGGMRWKQLAQTMSETISIVGMIFLLLTAAKVFGRFIVVSGVSANLVDFIVSLNPNDWQLMVGMIILYLILGCFLDGMSMLVTTVPIIYPVIQVMGIDPIWFAIVMIMAMETGLVTPPVGMNAYIVKSVAEPDVSLEDIFLGVLPFLGVMVLGIILVIIFPEIGIWLPSLR